MSAVFWVASLAGLLVAADPHLDLEEATIADLQSRMTAGKETARSLTEKYRARIGALDPALKSIIELNPEATAIADRLDAERKSGKIRGPLHGIPLLVKDNIDTADKMATSAGSLALADGHAAADAEVVRRLREAGAVIIGKTNLSEWANFRSFRSSSGWSARGGQTRNPYALDRSPSGSSSGSGAATAANLAAAAIGTETDGSITAPASVMSLVGLKPTIGLVSQSGIIPIAASQDTAGPMSRTVADAVVLMQAISDRPQDYSKVFDADALRGARIGVVRNYSGKNAAADKIFEQALEKLRQAGAILVDPVTLENADKIDADELLILEYEFKSQLETYLSKRGAAIKTLQDVITFNETNAEKEMPYFGQELFYSSAKRGPLTAKEYRAALARVQKRAKKALEKAFSASKLDVLIAPTNSPPDLIDLSYGNYSYLGTPTFPAVAGTPHLTVPGGFVHGLPVGVSFFGRAFGEPQLLRLGYAFEQLTKARKPPRLSPTAPIEPRPDLYRTKR